MENSWKTELVGLLGDKVKILERDSFHYEETDENVLGRGNNTVYKGTYDGKNVAVKKMSKVLVNKDVKSFVREIQMYYVTSHDKVPKMFGICIETDFLYVLIESIHPSKTFEKACKEGDYKQHIDYMIQITSIINDLHKDKIVHRDLKPFNILVDDKHVVHLIDFGLSKSIADSGATNDAKGTIDYMPPEAFSIDAEKEGDANNDGCVFNVSLCFDVWSLGCIISECLSGIRPWRNINWDLVTAMKKPKIKKKDEINNDKVTEFLSCGKLEFPIGEGIKDELKAILKLALTLHEKDRITVGGLLEKLKEYYTTL